MLVVGSSLYGQTTITVDPAVRYQRLEGWGVSLAWWAHIAGQKATPQQLNQLVRWLTDPDGLNMNIFRFNISGGDAPGHTHMRRDAQLPGYQPVKETAYDWNADSAQRSVLLAIHRLRPYAIYEAESYSPPYWMTKSGCTSGGVKGAPNLREDCYDRFADYLTEVVRHYKDQYGIVFRTIAPVNEPFSNWWKNNGSQEGCAFTAEQQLTLIKALHVSLQAKGMSAYTSLSLNDANSIDECLQGFERVPGAELLKGISQINTHTYAGVKRSALHELAAKNDKRLWQSESGPLDRKERGWDNFLLMGQRIITDMRELQPSAWCDWQYMSGGGLHDVWALVGYTGHADSGFHYARTKGFYCREQFSRFIVPGSVFISSEGKNALAALHPDNKSMVLVVINQDSSEQVMKIDLSRFREVKNTAVFVTDESRDCESRPLIDGNNKKNILYSLPVRSVTTLVFEVTIK